MATIWKYTFDIADKFYLTVPRDAKFLSVQVQDGKPTMWFMVRDMDERVRIWFRVYGTGNPFSDGIFDKYLGTIQMPPFVWHVFMDRWIGE